MNFMSIYYAEPQLKKKWLFVEFWDKNTGLKRV
jgi:hypothetical protein